MQVSDMTNSAAAQAYERALVDLAVAKNAALEAKYLHERALDQAFILEEGSVDLRKAKARTAPAVMERQLKYIKAQTDENLARAKADGAGARFEEWRTAQSTRRAEMQML